MAFNYEAGQGLIQGIMRAADERKAKKQAMLQSILQDPEAAQYVYGPDQLNRVMAPKQREGITALHNERQLLAQEQAMSPEVLARMPQGTSKLTSQNYREAVTGSVNDTNAKNAMLNVPVLAETFGGSSQSAAIEKMYGIPAGTLDAEKNRMREDKATTAAESVITGTRNQVLSELGPQAFFGAPTDTKGLAEWMSKIQVVEEIRKVPNTDNGYFQVKKVTLPNGKKYEVVSSDIKFKPSDPMDVASYNNKFKLDMYNKEKIDKESLAAHQRWKEVSMNAENKALYAYTEGLKTQIPAGQYDPVEAEKIVKAAREAAWQTFATDDKKYFTPNDPDLVYSSGGNSEYNYGLNASPIGTGYGINGLPLFPTGTGSSATIVPTNTNPPPAPVKGNRKTTSGGPINTGKNTNPHAVITLTPAEKQAKKEQQKNASKNKGKKKPAEQSAVRIR